MKVAKFKLGIFILAAFGLALAMLFFFGASDLFARKAKISTMFTESVQGLAVGSAVKYKGVPIGSVSGISIAADSKMIVVDMDIDLSSFRKSAFSESPYRNQDDFEEFLRKEIDSGLRCRQEMAGVTGLKFIELDYFVQPGTPYAALEDEIDDTFLVPTAPSVFQDIIKSLTTSLDRISRIRFEEISDTLIQSMAELNQLLSGPDVRETLTSMRNMSNNLEQTTGSLNRVLTEDRIEQVVTLLEKSLRDLTRVTDQVIAEINSAEIKESATAFRRSANHLSEAAQAISDRRETIAATMDKMIQTLDSLRELLDYLNDDPGALVRGKRKPELDLQD